MRSKRGFWRTDRGVMALPVFLFVTLLVAPVARSLAMAEALVGQLFPTC